MTKKSPVTLIGLDGATWDLIDPLLAKGKLPNIAHLMENGSYGRLETLPGYTSPALWASILTGKSPSRHGVSDFYTATGAHLRVKNLFEILDSSAPVGLFQMYAARSNQHPTSFIVPSHIDSSSVAYPSDLAFINQLGSEKNFYQYLINTYRCLSYSVPVWLIAKVLHLFLLRKFGLIDELAWDYRRSLLSQPIRANLAASLIKRHPIDFFASLFTVLDHLGHYYWHFWQPSKQASFDRTLIKKYGQVLDKAYIEIDHSIGLILKALPKQGLVLVVSDHGMETVSTELGGKPLTLKGHFILEKMDLNNAFVTELLPPFTTIFHAKDPGWNSTATKTLNAFLENSKLDDGTSPFSIENPNERTFLVKGQTGLRHKLNSSITLPSGEQLKILQVFFENQEITGTHADFGVMLLSGPNIKNGRRLPESNLLDLVPTLLALTGHPVARDMEGKVIEPAIEDAYLERHPITFIDSYEPTDASVRAPHLSEEDQAEIESRMRDLGYLA